MEVGDDDKDKHNSRVECDDRDEVVNNKVNSNKVEDNEITVEKNNPKISKYEKKVGSLDFFTLKAGLGFTK